MIMLGPIVPGGGTDPALEGRVTELENKVEALEEAPPPEVYDDTALSGRVTAVEDAIGEPDVGLSARVTALESPPSAFFDYHAHQLITSNTTWDRDAALAAHCAGIDPDDIRLDVEIIGAGASGAGASSGAPGTIGGAPGGVTVLRQIHPLELASSIAVTIGVGGSAKSGGGANAGGDTLFGDFIGMGGRGFAANGSPIQPFVAALLPPSDIPLGVAGAYQNDNTGHLHAAGSHGPGAGGGGNTSTNGGPAGGKGGDSGCRTASSKKSGGAAGTQTVAPGAGADATGAFDFGSGGGGGGSGNSAAICSGASGGSPGGGGGGGGRQSQNSYSGNGGPGGNGAIRIRYYVRRGVAA